MYLACADTEITKRQEATEKRCRDMIAKHHRKPWWRKIGRETELRDMILAEWSAFSKWMDDRIAFMRNANAPADRPAIAGKVRRDVGLVLGRQSTLDDCPPGLFLFDGGYGFKTEYNDVNGPEAYCLDSGEYFWGGTNGDVRARRMLLVTPFHLEPNDAADLPATAGMVRRDVGWFKEAK